MRPPRGSPGHQGRWIRASALASATTTANVLLLSVLLLLLAGEGRSQDMPSAESALRVEKGSATGMTSEGVSTVVDTVLKGVLGTAFGAVGRRR